MLIPHMAGPAVDRRAYITHILLEDILSIKEGKKPANAIAPEYAGAMSKG
jgi:phosphoglycerate dehydrogenase-like enzyme